MQFIPVPVVELKSLNIVQNRAAQRRPCVFKSLDLGSCTSAWTPEYLKQALGSAKNVDVHHAQEDVMRFEAKNFVIKKETFPDFIDAVANGEKRYLRALHINDQRKPANFFEDFESIANDFHLPDQLKLAKESMHSSVLRISGPVNMWLHYDCLENILCQIRGSKRLLLFSPDDVSHLGIPPGRSSSDVDVFSNKDAWIDTRLKNTHPYEVYLEPGDVLFLPAFWAHAALPLDGLSIAVNIFFKTMNANCYAVGKDIYGNRDVQQYGDARKDIAKAAERFKDMPPEMARFYLARLAEELAEKGRERK